MPICWTKPHDKLANSTTYLSSAHNAPFSHRIFQQMTTWLITRHPGALGWVQQNAILFDRHLAHLDDVTRIQAGDKVIGTLPVHLAAQVCARGASYWNLSLQIPEAMRGQELSAQQLGQCDAILERFDVRGPISTSGNQP